MAGHRGELGMGKAHVSEAKLTPIPSISARATGVMTWTNTPEPRHFLMTSRAVG